MHRLITSGTMHGMNIKKKFRSKGRRMTTETTTAMTMTATTEEMTMTMETMAMVTRRSCS